MAKNLSTAVAILAVLWLIRDLYALESNQTSNDGDLYFDDSANRSSTLEVQPDASRGPLKFPEMIDSLDVKQLLKYVLSLVYTLSESNESPSDELKSESNFDVEDVVNNQNISTASPVLSSQTNSSEIAPTKYSNVNEDDRDISESDEMHFEDGEDSNDNDNYDDINDKNNEESESISTTSQIIFYNTTVTPISQNSSVNESNTGMLDRDLVDNNGLKLDITSDNATNKSNIPTSFRLFEEEFIDYYINKQPNSPQYDQQKTTEEANNTSQPTIISKGLNKTTENQAPWNGSVSGQENKPLNNSFIPLINENIDKATKLLDQNQNNRGNPVKQKQNIPQTSIHNVYTKEIPYSPSQNPFLRADDLILPYEESEKNNEPYRQNTIVQSPFQGTYFRSPFQNVPQPYNTYNKLEPLNYQNTFNQKEPTYNFNRDTDPFTSKLIPSAQQPPSNVLPLQLSNYNYNQQYDRIPAVLETRDQQNKFQQGFVPQNNPLSQYNFNQDVNVFPKSVVNKPPYFMHYKLKSPLHTGQIVKPPVSGSTFSDLPQDKDTFDKYTNPVIENKVPLYSRIPSNPLNREKSEPVNNVNLLKQPHLLVPQNPIKPPPENPDVTDHSVMQNQTGYLPIQNDFPQVTIAPPRDTAEVLMENSNNKPISEVQPTNINISLPQNEYNNTEIQPSQDVFNNTGPLFQTPFNTEEPSKQDVETTIPSTNLENVTATTGQSITILKNQSNIEPINFTFYNFSEELQPKVNSASLDGNSSGGSSEVNESENGEESDVIGRENEEESDVAESGNEEESDIVESDIENESDTDEDENENESDVVESDDENESDVVESDDENESDTGESDEESDTDESEIEAESDDSENSNNEESENEGKFDKLLRILDYMEEMMNNETTTQSAENSSNADIEYFTEIPTNVTDFSTQTENVASPKPEEAFNTILEYILKFSNNPFFAGMREEKNATMQ